MKPFYCSIFEIWDIIKFRGYKDPFLISTEMNGQFYRGSHTICTLHETILQRFEIWDIINLEDYKDPISNKYRNEWSVYTGHPILHAHLI